jgi:hypothetical protein
MEFSLCQPAIIYLALSSFITVLFFIQNVGNTRVYCLGQQECDVQNNTIILFIQILYIILFTLILNTVCDIVSPFFSWVIVIVGFLTYFISMGLFILYNSNTFTTLYLV